LLLAGSAFAQGGVTFQDIAAGGGSGLSFSHAPSTRLQALIDAFADDVMDVPTEYIPAPFKPYGVPGVAIFDYDRDGDLDIYVTNGPGAANALFANQLHESGHLQFVDVAAAAGVALTEVDSQGVCFGDIDNDRDKDLLVLGFNGAHHLFANDGDGTFTDITTTSHIAGQTFNGVSCSMGDVDNDGLLDVAIANTFDFTEMLSLTTEPVVHNQPNQLFLNQGGNVFTDVSQASGIRTKVVTPEIPGDLTWGVAMVDYDEDGDVDLFFGDDMRGSGFDKAFIRLYKNDGTGHFTDATGTAHLDTLGSWRGLAFGDLNCDGRIDLFVTNLGDYIFFPGNIPPGTFSSAWFLQQADGTFARQGPGPLVTVPTGWGDSMIDYDNDGDLDLVDYGNQDNTLFWENANPGVILNNNGGCTAQFSWDQQAVGTSRHTRRNVEGLATGDLNDDGFDDIVSIASFNATPDTPLVPDFSNPLNSVFDVAAFAVFVTVPTEDPNKFAFTGPEGAPGTLSVEINSGNHNNWAKVELVGTAGITTGGQSNRDGIGAVVSYTRPVNNTTLSSVTRPVLGGASMLSQNSLELTFGLNNGRRGLVEVLWPGGTKNRLYGVRLNERISFPEIPCSFDADWANTGDYVTCVISALDEIRDAGLIDQAGHVRFFLSAIHAYFDVNGIPF
jgi:hypothetical protein